MCFSVKTIRTPFLFHAVINYHAVQVAALYSISLLHCVHVQIEYSRKEIRELLQMIDVGNRPRWSQKNLSGLKRTVSAFGIVGMHCFFQSSVI